MGDGVGSLVVATGPHPFLRAASPTSVGPSGDEPSDIPLLGVKGAVSNLPVRSGRREHSEPWACVGDLWVVGVCPSRGGASIAECEEASRGGDPSEGSQPNVRPSGIPVSTGACRLTAGFARRRVSRVIAGNLGAGA